MVSADGGKSWGEAALDGPVLSKALTRFRMPWRWDGQPVVLQSRAWDEAGNVQPTRGEMFAERGEPKVNRPGDGVPDGPHERHHELGQSTAKGRPSMSMAKALQAGIALAFAAAAGSASAADLPGLGKPVSEAELALWDMSIGPDGKGLPPGSGTAAQGAAIYAQKCEVCHGKGGEGGRNAMLINPPGKTDRNMANYVPTATTIFDFTRRAMP